MTGKCGIFPQRQMFSTFSHHCDSCDSIYLYHLFMIFKAKKKIENDLMEMQAGYSTTEKKENEKLNGNPKKPFRQPRTPKFITSKF